MNDPIPSLSANKIASVIVPVSNGYLGIDLGEREREKRGEGERDGNRQKNQFESESGGLTVNDKTSE